MSSTTIDEKCRKCLASVNYGARTYVNGVGPYCQRCSERGVPWGMLSTVTYIGKPQPTREQRLEAALREIEQLTNAEWVDLLAIRNKCREALRTGEGE